MSSTRIPGPIRLDGSLNAPTSPGPLGFWDASQPFSITLPGDRPGPAGSSGDRGRPQNSCRIEPHWSTSRDENSDETTEIWVLSKDDFVKAVTQAGNAGAKWTSTVIDVNTLRKLIQDFGIKGTYYVKTYGGKEYIVFKGYAGLRKVFTGTRYSATNAKVLTMAVGRSGVLRSGIKGGALSLVLVTAANVTEYVLNDDVTLEQFGFKLGKDLAKTAIAAVIGTMAGVALAAGAPVVVGLGVSIAVGYVVGEGLDYLDENSDEILDAVQTKLDALTRGIYELLDEANQTLNAAGQTIAQTVDALLRMKRDYDRVEREIERLRRMLRYPSFGFR